MNNIIMGLLLISVFLFYYLSELCFIYRDECAFMLVSSKEKIKLTYQQFKELNQNEDLVFKKEKVESNIFGKATFSTKVISLNEYFLVYLPFADWIMANINLSLNFMKTKQKRMNPNIIDSTKIFCKIQKSCLDCPLYNSLLAF